ncbi:MAG: serine/threonine protein kinase [Crocinitomicaceae bacterium]|nr:serine/threonine protein kinase [Crocinitomicaceae bacterium]MCF8433519.1 serine/threonine protein kinase [Crocinitomicaceae bacterium]
MELINTTIGKYTLTKYIGEGGMASVYEGTHLFLGTKAAVKVLSPMLSKNDQFRQRFRNEAAFMASLDHPNITKVLDFEDSDEVLAIVMELLEGSDLNDLVKEKGAMTFEEFKPLFIQILDAFKYAHNKGIVHRDIKPSNIFIDSHGKVKILDFGIAKLFGQGNEMTQTGTQMGTPAYMSPEQVKGDKSIDHRSDIYALGVTLFYAMEGRSPYDTDNESQFDIFNKIVYEELPVLTANSEHTHLIQKACQKDRNLRYQQVEDFENELNRGEAGDAKTIFDIKSPSNHIKETIEKKIEPSEKTIIDQAKPEQVLEQKAFFNLNRLLIGSVFVTIFGVTITRYLLWGPDLYLLIPSVLFICSAALQFFINNKIVLKITFGVFAFYWLIIAYLDYSFFNGPLLMLIAAILSILARNKAAFIVFMISYLLYNINFLEYVLSGSIRSLFEFEGQLFLLFISSTIIFFFSRKNFGVYTLGAMGLMCIGYGYNVFFLYFDFESFFSSGNNLVLFLFLPLIELSSKLIGDKSMDFRKHLRTNK